MSVLEKIKSKTNNIDVELLKKRLIRELNVKKDNTDAVSQVEYALLDTLIIILDTIHQPKVPDGLYTTWLSMTKDYWYLNKYDDLFKNSESGETENRNSNKKTIQSIQIGDTTTTFADKSSQIEINGTAYNTETIDFSEDILVEKYKKALYRHRRFRR